jgi:F-type H+-transporting ATPase subunit gamma
LPQVEIVYTKFASLIQSDPIVQTMLPLTPAGEICDVDGNCVDPDEDELFKLTTKSGELTLEREKASCLICYLIFLVLMLWEVEEACEQHL